MSSFHCREKLCMHSKRTVKEVGSLCTAAPSPQKKKSVSLKGAGRLKLGEPLRTF